METVHFTQQTFRDIMNSFARPGEQHTLSETMPMNGLYGATAAVLLTLVDGEVSVYAEDEALQKEIFAWTNTKRAAIDEADFIVLRAGSSAEQITAAIEAAKIGTLVDPQKSATLIIELQGDKQSYIVTGPGIEHDDTLEASLHAQWIAARAKKNREFPLGIDIICVTADDTIFSLPRTTKIEVTN